MTEPGLATRHGQREMAGSRRLADLRLGGRNDNPAGRNPLVNEPIDGLFGLSEQVADRGQGERNLGPGWTRVRRVEGRRLHQCGELLAGVTGVQPIADIPFGFRSGSVTIFTCSPAA